MVAMVMIMLMAIVMAMKNLRCIIYFSRHAGSKYKTIVGWMKLTVILLLQRRYGYGIGEVSARALSFRLLAL
ncbi:hypothetical protein EDC96DRAFT_530415 [Choanephora cucurbitarum]|nr:hypothetical protein EDC96DRAFT_530415 [Choanephora cucurbitarum]